MGLSMALNTNKIVLSLKNLILALYRSILKINYFWPKIEKTENRHFYHPISQPRTIVEISNFIWKEILSK